MSKIQWEYDVVEKPFCQQLQVMGWQWIEGDKGIPDFTERQNFREVLLKGRLAAALRKLNLIAPAHFRLLALPARPGERPRCALERRLAEHALVPERLLESGEGFVRATPDLPFAVDLSATGTGGSPTEPEVERDRWRVASISLTSAAEARFLRNWIASSAAFTAAR